jgi:Rps23 Pro-64 3,4-dihydroxylase Tpa1-like proline 4-hydroxylase
MAQIRRNAVVMGSVDQKSVPPALDKPEGLGPLPPHRLVRNFLPAATARSLLAWSAANEALFKPATVGSRSGERVDPTVRVSLAVRKFGPLKEVLRRQILAVAPELIRDLRINPLEIADTDLQLVAHNDGAFYRRHIDTFTGPTSAGAGHRFLSAVYYIQRRPRAFTGGALRLHRFGGAGGVGDFVDIEPEHNLLAAFPSWAPHEVRPVSCPSKAFAHSRFAVNIWLVSPGT